SGNYSLTNLNIGTYKAEFKAPGFQSQVFQDVHVRLDAAARLDAQLTVGQASAEVTVSSAPPALVTDRAEVSVTLDNGQVEDLPVLNRNLTALQLLLPGTAKVPWQHATSENPQGGIQINNNGQRFGSTNFMIDGMDNNDPVLGIIVINPNIDSVGEMKHTSGNFDAEFAQAGGAVIQVETKSGTNGMHGSAFEFLQNNIFNARNPFSEPNGPPPLRWNDFGGSFGGPIKHNKLFYFGDFEGFRRRTGASVLTTVPTDAVRNGDFSALGVPIFDPATGDANGMGRVQFPGNRIPANRFSQPAVNLLKLLPMPNSGPAGAVNNNFVASGSEKFDSNRFDVKADHYISDSWKYFVRYSYADFNKLSPPAFGATAGGPSLGGLGFAGTSQTRNQNLVGSLSHVFSATFLTDVRFGISRYRVNVLPLYYGSNAGQSAGIPGVNLPGRPDTSGLPSFQANGNGGFSLGYSLDVNQCNCPLRERELVYQFVNNWTKVSGNHTLKWGVDLRSAQNIRIPSDRRRNGQFVFSPSITGSPGVDGSGLGDAAFLLGLPSAFSRFAQTAIDAEDRQYRMFYFVEDKWRATRQLTVSVGLRWDTWFPNFSIHSGEGSRYDVTNNSVYIAGIGGNSKSGGVRTQWKNFSPRLSFAYELDPKTVVRSGFGRSYFQEIFGASFNNTANNYPTLISQQVVQPNPYTGVFPLSQGPPAIVFPPIPSSGILALPDGIGAGYVPRDLSYSYVDAWNFSV
ncbi:MAG: TonB-dependent receptor, partial [Acidobacteriota bacterium]|nr:TonB-dependent receptor [Acidobacteriota bacterium]